jgi:CPA2 family monovalent cation:H+ antiporter-2
MESILLALFIAIFLSTLLNIVLTKYKISHIIGYIATGTIVSLGFDFNGSNIHALELIGEFGIVFLMFTIGLELSFEKIKKMKDILLTNGLLQVVFSILVVFIFSYFLFKIDLVTSIIISLGFSVSSTAIVLTYLKTSKDIHTPYGEKSMGILIFQDLAVIPFLLLITFLSNDTLSISEVLAQTFFYALFIVVLMFTIGKKVVRSMLRFTATSNLEELFLGAVFAIVLGSSLLAHSLGFTYSLGAFIAGMIIAETGYHVKVESDIASYKDLLLGAFFFSVGTKIDPIYFFMNLHTIFAVFIGAFILKAIVIYTIIRKKSDKNTSAKTALALASVGEFSFAIFALAHANSLISDQIASFLILITVISMILTPFIVNNIYKLSSYFEKEFYESDVITPIQERNHVIIAGFSTLGRIIAQRLTEKNIPFVIISDNLKHVLLARKLGYMGYFGHLDKTPVLESLKADESSSIIITMSSTVKKRLICEALIKFCKQPNIILKIDRVEERKELRDLHIKSYIDSNREVGEILVQEARKFYS